MVLGAARVMVSWFGQSRDRNSQVGRDLKAVAGHASGLHTGGVDSQGIPAWARPTYFPFFWRDELE